MSDVQNDSTWSVDESGRAGEAWMSSNADIIAALPIGTTVIVNLATGAYVASADWQAAWDEFDDRFGFGRPSFMFTVGQPIIVGGGLWLKSSDR